MECRFHGGKKETCADFEQEILWLKVPGRSDRLYAKNQTDNGRDEGDTMSADLLRWLITAFITVLVGINFFWIKRYISRQDDRDKKWEDAGGVVTRDMYFKWCKENQAGCPACESYRLLMDWRTSMMEKGGVMTKGEHTVLCKEITKEVGDHLCERLDEMFANQEKLVAKEFQLLRLEIARSKT
jgi:hypothetical protein